MNVLKSNIAELVKLHEDYSKVDSCIYILYKAENNSRLYAVTADRNYLIQFSSQIQKVSVFFSELNLDLNPDKELRPDFKRLVKQKKLKTENYLKLRKLTDSLVIGFSRLGLIEREVETKLDLPSTKKQFKIVTSFDTIKHQAPPGKKFFGRLAEAFSGKTKKDSSVTIIKTQKKIDVSPDVRSFNREQLKKIEEYYRKLYANTNKLKDDEKAILFLNNQLVDEIISILEAFKKNEISYIIESRNFLGNELFSEIKMLDGITIINVLLLISLVVIILYNIIKLYKNERILIGLSKRSSQDSHSKSRFLANMSHEIRTPLNSVVGFSEQLSKSELTEEQADQVSAIRNSSEMLLELVNEILDFSKYEVGKINFEHIPFSPGEELTEVYNSMNILAVNKNILLENKITIEKEIFLAGDRLRLKQVLMNLLTNAIKFTASGQVTLKAQLAVNGKKHIVLNIQVEDTGIGIAEEDLEFIFDEFAQVYSSAKTKHQGTGLGLAICKKIVELQEGKISVSSIPGKGSVFSFEIPYDVAKKTEEESTEQETERTGKLTGKRILLVDDNKMNVLLIQTVLKKWKIDYDSAYDGREALDLFKKNDYDLVLTDIQMPIMGGVELTHEIRYNGNFSKSNIPVLGVTAHVLQEDRDAYLKAGMNDLVLKPFLEQELIDKISKYL